MAGLGTSFSPKHADAHLEYLAQGAATANRDIAEVDLQVACHVAIGEDVEALIKQRMAAVAFALGAMGSAKN